MIAELGVACLIGFATMGGADPGELVSNTYRELLTTLGGRKMSRATIEKMVEAKDPFVIPEDKAVDLSSLPARLGDFKKLVEAKGWNTPETREKLVGVLSTFVVETETASVKQKEATQPRVYPSFRLLNGFQKILIPPDGGPLVILGGKSKEVGPVINFDPKTGTQTSYPGNFEYRPWGQQFSPDGKEVFIGRTGWTIQRVPWRDGKLQWEESTFLKSDHKVNSNKPVDQIAFDTTGTKLIVGNDNFPLSRPILIFDLTTGQAQVVKENESVFSSRGRALRHQWGQIPGTDRFFIVRNSRANGLQMSEYTIGPNGAVKSLAKGTDFEGAPDGKVKWHPSNGKSFLVQSAFTVTFHSDIGANPISIADTTRAGGRVSAVAYHPNGTEAIVITESERRGSSAVRPRLMRIELSTGEVKGWTELEDVVPDSVRVLPDGSILVESTIKNLVIPADALIP